MPNKSINPVTRDWLLRSIVLIAALAAVTVLIVLASKGVLFGDETEAAFDTIYAYGESSEAASAPAESAAEDAFGVSFESGVTELE